MESGFRYTVFLIWCMCLFTLQTCKSVDFAVLEEVHVVEHFNYQKDTILDKFNTSAEGALESDGIDATGHKILGIPLLLLLLLLLLFCMFYPKESNLKLKMENSEKWCCFDIWRLAEPH